MNRLLLPLLVCIPLFLSAQVKPKSTLASSLRVSPGFPLQKETHFYHGFKTCREKRDLASRVTRIM